MKASPTITQGAQMHSYPLCCRVTGDQDPPAHKGGHSAQVMASWVRKPVGQAEVMAHQLQCPN